MEDFANNFLKWEIESGNILQTGGVVRIVRRVTVALCAIVATTIAPACSTSGTPQPSSTTNTQSAVHAPSPDPDPTTAADTQKPIAPTVVDQGWSVVADGGFISFGALLRNPGPDSTFVDVSMTSVDADGNPLETTGESLYRLNQGEEAYVAATFIRSAGAADVHITVDPGRIPSSYDRIVDITVDAKLIQAGLPTRISITAQTSGSTDIRGGAKLFAVFRDASGAIIGGSSGFTQGAIRPGNTLSEAPLISGIAPEGTSTVDVTIDALT